MFGDNSKRTKQITTNAISMMIAVILFFVGIPWYFVGSHSYNKVVARSSSPIGTTLTFQRSQAEVIISDIYTDKNKDVLIARLSVPPQSQANLPYKGTDYKVFISSKSTNGLKEMPVLFGRFSTDGDMFVIIPKPTDTVYSIFIQNKKFINNTSSDNSSSIIVEDIDDASISKALSSYRYDENSDTNKNAYTVPSDLADIIGFRLTLNPAFKSDSYKAKIIDENLLINNSDGTSEFDFEKFFNIVFKESALKVMQNEHDKKHEEKTRMEARLRDYEARLAENANDTTAKQQAESLRSSISSLDSQMTSLVESMSSYNELQYDPALFNNMQTKAKVIKSK